MFPVLCCRAHPHVSYCECPLPVLVFSLPLFCVHLRFICSLVPMRLNLSICPFCSWCYSVCSWRLLQLKPENFSVVCTSLQAVCQFFGLQLLINQACIFCFSTHLPLCVLCLGPFSISTTGTTVIERIPGLLCKHGDRYSWTKTAFCHPTDITISQSIPEILERGLCFAALC